MKHWDLNPGETVHLGRTPNPGEGTLMAIFRFRTTLLACFETPNSVRLLEYGLLDDGTLRDSRGPVYIAGEDRHTRMGGKACR